MHLEIKRLTLTDWSISAAMLCWKVYENPWAWFIGKKWWRGKNIETKDQKN